MPIDSTHRPPLAVLPAFERADMAPHSRRGWPTSSLGRLSRGKNYSGSIASTLTCAQSGMLSAAASFSRPWPSPAPTSF